MEKSQTYFQGSFSTRSKKPTTFVNFLSISPLTVLIEKKNHGNWGFVLTNSPGQAMENIFRESVYEPFFNIFQVSSNSVNS